MPDPVTKITWENVILVSEKTALELGFPAEDFIFGSHALTKKDSPRGTPTARLSVNGKVHQDATTAARLSRMAR